MKALIFALPLVCWLLAARTVAVGWIVGTALAACVAVEIALAKSWVFPGMRVTLLVAFAVATAVILAAGIVLEGRRAGVRRLRSTGRGATGLVLSVFYCVSGLGGALLVVLAVSVMGVPASTPSSGEVLPLPAGLVVATNRDEGCGSGSQTICSREIQVGSTTERADEDVAQQLLHHLTQRGGWPLAPDGTGDWSACRVEGQLLDSHHVCLELRTGQGRVTIRLETGDSW